MRTYNFKKQFAADVEAGIKCQTIRKEGKLPPPNVGEVLRLYTGMRTKYCRLLRAPLCEKVTPIRITRHYIRLNGVVLDNKQSHFFAKADGFADLMSFLAFFVPPGTRSFKGHLIEWRPLCPRRLREQGGRMIFNCPPLNFSILSPRGRVIVTHATNDALQPLCGDIQMNTRIVCPILNGQRRSSQNIPYRSFKTISCHVV